MVVVVVVMMMMMPQHHCCTVIVVVVVKQQQYCMKTWHDLQVYIPVPTGLYPACVLVTQEVHGRSIRTSVELP